MEIVGALTSGRLAEAELARGLFDGAVIAVRRVDWASPADQVLVLSGTVGGISRGPAAFADEVRGRIPGADVGRSKRIAHRVAVRVGRSSGRPPCSSGHATQLCREPDGAARC
ncbi:baseplate hub protein [Methylobacterium tarhaniae]|uniref:baseplate hub domain-containing protein n=1 Tax=Methylobacterium tarhaniae TaxID=1187852 RepID=UPI001ABF3AB4|nr:DUF2163 domain-containing protein [Methylobacterium tarhaniae]